MGHKLPFSLPPAMRYPAYRAFWLGMLASVSGFQMLRFGQFWLMYELTGSPLALGYIGLANGIPAIFLNLFGGVAADRMDQRRLIYVTQTITASLIFILATVTFLEMVNIWHLLIISFMAGAVEAFDQPARRALFPQLIERRDMMSAVALNSSIWPLTRTMSPAIAGLIIGIAGTAVCFSLAAFGFLVMAAITFGLRVPPVTRAGNAGVSKELLEGLNFIRKDSTFAFLISMTFFSSFFGNSYQALMPIFAVDILGVDALGLGFLQSASAVGSVIVTGWLAFGGGAGYKGPLIMGGAIMSGLSIAAFALTSQFIGSFYLATFLMLAMGVFNTGFTTASQSALQMMVPDHIRGRVMGFYGMTYNIRPLGGMQAGALANVGAIGAPFAVAIGGLAVVAFPIISLLANKKVRNLSAVLRQAEASRTTTGQSQTPAPSAAGD